MLIKKFFLLTLLNLFLPSFASEKCPRSNVNTKFPIAQIKVLFLLFAKDEECARKTQDDFISTYPIVSQVTTAILYLTGNVIVESYFPLLVSFVLFSYLF